ncbi:MULTISPECIES: glycine cleavage system protein GcvH [Psychrilyobacter]|uniref:Glycine cleavage system H protein n=1 Tax=Psychrilyobacter piezotolerans TaxID=2293438 RepID=A0ABX9KFQ4_9FUSO|nr:MULTISPECIES: glycine cleavage system protein GcvH [Psychrilyobacter]MCS5422282.1 glycine cleavage system protein GcvH [Psychrilyobacter sp. S5]NDI78308.1 glycine cleavage system protein GcvH [Psychrilyobacter piezotolerans]RDE60843.1 glycine cleavage system protein GcvH [Psychrilyobacter sp. S5]REI40632.1 glycine cleavage system protein GcvH [Psychrilyobacter piezotolerans]
MENLLYSKEHEWIKVEGNTALVGITDHAQKSLGEIVYVELPEIDDEFEAAEAFGVIESVKAASDSYMPVSGKIIEINEDLEDNPTLLNEDPYGTWIIKIELSDKGELDSLLDLSAYNELCEEDN